MQNVRRIDFQTGLANSDGDLVEGTERDVCILFNKTVISAEEVRDLIESGRYEYDERVVVTTSLQAENLKSKR